MQTIPIVGVISCRKDIGVHPYHIAGDKYVQAVLRSAECIPLIIPALGDDLPLQDLLNELDGILLTGSPSNVEPRLYGGAVSDEGTLHDSRRDSTALPLAIMAMKQGVPILGICRGFQEMNVALGGTLHQKVHDLGRYMDHREPDSPHLETLYRSRHSVQTAEGGALDKLGLPAEFQVNSIHGQGVESLAPGLHIEALASDGLVEAFSYPDASAFAIGVQWHPEWRSTENPYSTVLFSAFGDACRNRLCRRNTRR